MFAPSPATTPFPTPLISQLMTPLQIPQTSDLEDDGLLPPAAVDTEAMDGGLDLLPPAAIDTEEFGDSGYPQTAKSPLLTGSKSPPLSAKAAPFAPTTAAAKAQAK